MKTHSFQAKAQHFAFHFPSELELASTERHSNQLKDHFEVFCPFSSSFLKLQVLRNQRQTHLLEVVWPRKTLVVICPKSAHCQVLFDLKISFQEGYFRHIRLILQVIQLSPPLKLVPCICCVCSNWRMPFLQQEDRVVSLLECAQAAQPFSGK